MKLLRDEYPRPQFRRDDWIMLNGEWEFEYDDNGDGAGRGRWKHCDGGSKNPCGNSGSGKTGYRDFIKSGEKDADKKR